MRIQSIVMRHLFLAATLVFSSSNAYGRTKQPAYTGSSMTAKLNDLRGKYRPLLVFAASDKDTKFIEQVHLISEGAWHLRERQVLFIPLTGDGGSGSSANKIDASLTAHLSAQDASEARQRYHVSPFDFTVMLIGKDGGEKFRTHNPVTIKRLNTVIDAMPMRQQEIQDGHTK